jgi:hypothetical protein
MSKQQKYSSRLKFVQILNEDNVLEERNATMLMEIKSFRLGQI